jgi:hypothetical protein
MTGYSEVIFPCLSAYELRVEGYIIREKGRGTFVEARATSA